MDEPEPRPGHLHAPVPGHLHEEPGGGQTEREPPVDTWEGVGPWGGEVTITPLKTGLWGTRFEVRALWTGPGFFYENRPWDADRDRPTLTVDQVLVEDLVLAKMIAGQVIERLRRPERPDLPALAAELVDRNQ